MTGIRRLLVKTRQEQKNLRELELRLHQEQISPHFLYNTLDSIVWMAEGGNNCQVVEMTTDLSDFFRTVLSGGRDFITIEEEESHIRSYLKIQKIRYEDILDYSIEIEPSIRHRIVLKMLLQPLVENALYHGSKISAAADALCSAAMRIGMGLSLRWRTMGLAWMRRSLPPCAQADTGAGRGTCPDRQRRIWVT